jgi:hypothetical protein
MVDLVVLQTVSYIIAALSFAVTCAYYIMNLRNTQKNMKMTLETRRIGLIDSISSRLQGLEGNRNYQEVMRCEWTDYEDFIRKYGSNYNPEASALRSFFYGTYDSLGSMLRKGMVEKEDLYDHGLYAVIEFWTKYRSVIEEGRKRLHGSFWLSDLEYLANEMMKVHLKNDPSYKVPETFGVILPEK